MILKMEKNYPNANSCLMFTFSVVVLHWLDGGRRWLLARRAEPTVPAAADCARRSTGTGTVGRRMRDQRVSRDVTVRNVILVIARRVTGACVVWPRGRAIAIVDGRAATGVRHRCTL